MLLLLLACLPELKRPDSVPPESDSALQDRDGDGVFADQDCDDLNSTIYPGAPERCDGEDQDCDERIDEDIVETWYIDGDGDGFGDEALDTCDPPEEAVAEGGDCDDAASGVHPGAEERCDGVDQDCDSEVDEDAADRARVYPDADADGWGAGEGRLACEAGAGEVERPGDCDDGRDAVNPAATEVCNGLDDDCDGEVDGPTSADLRTFYADSDGDGWGAATSAVAACSAPSGWVELSGDCDDAASGTHPGADEVCGGGDEDCDAEIDEGSAVDASTWYADTDGDGYGGSTSTRACTRPSGYSTVSTDCNDASSSISPGATESCNATDDDCDSTIDDGASCPCTQKWSGSTAYLFCTSTASWTSASSACTTYGYHLVTVSSSTEDAWLDSTAYTVAGADVTWWGGYNDRSTEGSWAWTSGSSTYTNWYSGEPNNSGNEDCLEFNRWGNWQWNDLGCSNTLRYICES